MQRPAPEVQGGTSYLLGGTVPGKGLSSLRDDRPCPSQQSHSEG